MYLSQEIALKSSVPLLMAHHGNICGLCYKLQVMFGCLQLTVHQYGEQLSFNSDTFGCP